jgi:hypothetical protein
VKTWRWIDYVASWFKMFFNPWPSEFSSVKRKLTGSTTGIQCGDFVSEEIGLFSISCGKLLLSKENGGYCILCDLFIFFSSCSSKVEQTLFTPKFFNLFRINCFLKFATAKLLMCSYSSAIRFHSAASTLQKEEARLDITQIVG